MYKHLKIFEVGTMYSNCIIQYLKERTNIVKYISKLYMQKMFMYNKKEHYKILIKKIKQPVFIKVRSL